mmetsp:Transcript_118526/g.187679  ORF Transcript_118526/g.187679 Transcript_118526/m.187679 type:complete len:1057 (+) Transcript_118526:151-3321(+)
MIGTTMMKLPPRRPSVVENTDGDQIDVDDQPGEGTRNADSFASNGEFVIDNVDQALDNGATMFKNDTEEKVNNRYLAKAFTFKSVAPTTPQNVDEPAQDEFDEDLNALDKMRMGFLYPHASTKRGSIVSVTDQDLHQLFLDDEARFSPQQVRLPHIVHLVFGVLRPEEGPELNLKYKQPSTRTLAITRTALQEAYYCGKRLARKTINQPAFTCIMLMLTFYALFGPDMVQAYGRQPIDFAFSVFNTCVFFTFGIEVMLMLLGRQDYLMTPFILDIVAMLSLLGDTWFFQMGSESEVQDRMAVARSSRMTRMTRVVRIARVTRLVPYMMKLFGRNTVKFARTLLGRKLWRICIFLDTDRDGFLSAFDLKCFYLVILQELREFNVLHCKQLLLNDTELLNAQFTAKDECLSNLTYEAFIELFLSTKAGQQVLQMLTLDVEQDSGVWTMTNRISDSVGLKICVGIVILFMVLEILSPDIKDRSSEQVLAQLDQLARYWNEQGWSGGYEEVCTQVQKYMTNFNVLFLYLDGRTVVDGAGCVPQGITIPEAPLGYVETVMKDHELRATEVFQLCYPFREVVCEVGHFTSISLIDNRTKARESAQWTIVQTSILIVLLLLFVLMFNHFLSSFTKTLVHPLRVMVDDMLTSSSLELLQLDAENTDDSKPVYKSPVKVVDELNHLEKAYKHMNQAIKAWSLYVPPAVVQCLLHAGMEATIGMTRVDCTVLFCDIANFDEVYGHLNAHDVLHKLSQVLGRIADVIEANSGTLLEFIGDEVMAVFNAPNPMRLHPKIGVVTAMQIHEAIRNIEPTESDAGVEIVVKCQVGVHSARILAGNVGSPQRMKYGLLGDGVNLSARLKGLNSKYGTKTLVTHQVLEDIADFEEYPTFVSRPVDLVAVKGRKEPTTVHEVLSHLRGEETAELERLASSHDEAFRLYHQRHFKDALHIFSQVSTGFEKGLGYVRDEPSRQLASRCHAYIAQPPPFDWDGVERLKAKHFQVSQEPAIEESAQPSEVLDDTVNAISVPEASPHSCSSTLDYPKVETDNGATAHNGTVLPGLIDVD